MLNFVLFLQLLGLALAVDTVGLILGGTLGLIFERVDRMKR